MSKGLTLADVSGRSGMTRQAISKLENGQVANPTLDTLYRYAMALDAGITLGFQEIEPRNMRRSVGLALPIRPPPRVRGLVPSTTSDRQGKADRTGMVERGLGPQPDAFPQDHDRGRGPSGP